MSPSRRAIPRAPSPSSSSSSSSTAIPLESPAEYSRRIKTLREKMASVPRELCPASAESSPLSETRIANLYKSITDAVATAEGDTTSPKWGHVSRLTKLTCTNRGYVSAALGVRVGDLRPVATVATTPFEFVLPDTEEEWWECEERWEQWKNGSMSAEADAPGRASKYWKRDSQDEMDDQGRPVLADLVREKVAHWQATIEGGGEHEPLLPMREEGPSEAVIKNPSKTKEEGKKKVNVKPKPAGTTTTLSQSSLGFSVVKRVGTLTGKPSKGSSSHHGPQLIPMAVPRPPVVDVHMKSPTPEAAVGDPSPSSPLPLVDTNKPHISDVSEMSFLPPSFPSQLPTSTPVPAEQSKSGTVRRKPSPIAVGPSISPLSSPSRTAPSEQLPPRSKEGHEEPIITSSLPVSSLSSPTKRVQKRGHSRTPPPVSKSVLSTYGLSYMTPSKKKHRLEEGSSGAPLPPLTPPTMTSEATPPTTPPSIYAKKALGNAKDLPIPNTPDRQNLPTLTELLASSRRSKPRPRPPSRKLKSTHVSPQDIEKRNDTDVQDSELPAVVETPRSSPTRSYFSSPASGSSDSSPSSIRHRPRSPISPLFSQHPVGFAPPYASTQQADGGFLGVGSFTDGPGALLARGSSGFFGMGYNSQYDVELGVGRVNELLERDVDYDGWLRDPDIEEELDHPESLVQSQGEVVF